MGNYSGFHPLLVKNCWYSFYSVC